MPPKKSVSGVYEVIISRRTTRRFKNKPVPAELLERCINAARLAPSAANLQPLEFVAVDDEPLLQKVFSTLKWAAYIRPSGDPPEDKRPKAYIVILKNKSIATDSSEHDVGAVMVSIILVALADGVASCPLGSINREELGKLLDIPANYDIPLLLAMGYPDEEPVEEPLKDSVKYWKDDKGVIHVPKRKLENVLHRNRFQSGVR